MKRLEYLLGLEKAFTVVYWDQRGTGLSLRKNSNRADISVARMVGDTVSLSELLRVLVGLVRSPDYSVADVIRTIRGITATQAALLPELATTDLVRTMPRLDVRSPASSGTCS